MRIIVPVISFIANLVIGSYGGKALADQLNLDSPLYATIFLYLFLPIIFSVISLIIIFALGERDNADAYVFPAGILSFFPLALVFLPIAYAEQIFNKQIIFNNGVVSAILLVLAIAIPIAFTFFVSDLFYRYTRNHFLPRAERTRRKAEEERAKAVQREAEERKEREKIEKKRQAEIEKLLVKMNDMKCFELNINPFLETVTVFSKRKDFSSFSSRLQQDDITIKTQAQEMNDAAKELNICNRINIKSK